MYASTIIEGVDDKARLIRRTVARYLTLASLMVFQNTSIVIKKRFPTMDHLIEAGRYTFLYSVFIYSEFITLLAHKFYNAFS